MADVQNELKNGHSVILHVRVLHPTVDSSMSLLCVPCSTPWEQIIVPSSTGDVTAY